MSLDQCRIESMLFNYETVNRTDYRPYELKAPVYTTYKPKPKSAKKTGAALKDVHTLVNYKTKIPFNLLHKPRPIVNEDPTFVQPAYFEPPDKDLKQVIKTRPRLIMTPAVSMDDIADPEVRQILVENVYMSDMSRGMREGVRPYFRVAAPFPGPPAKANPITLPKLLPPVVPPEWRMDSITWDQRQLRAHCDATQRFWLGRDPPKCNACDVANKIAAQKKIECQMRPGRQLSKRKG